MPPYEENALESGISAASSSESSNPFTSDAKNQSELIRSPEQKMVFDEAADDLKVNREAYEELEKKYKQLEEQVKAWKLREELNYSFIEEMTDNHNDQLLDLSDFNKILIEKLQSSIQERDEALAKVDSLEKGKELSNLMIKKIVSERDEVKKDAAKYRKERNDVRYKLTEAQDRKQSLKRKVKRLTKQRDEAESKFDALRKAVCGNDEARAKFLAKNNLPHEIVLVDDCESEITRKTVM